MTILVFLALSARTALCQNPVTNGGFEASSLDGTPSDWQYVGRAVEPTTDAHSGQRALKFTRAKGEQLETGLNRDWQPDSGKQGKMLAERKGGLRFFYKAIRSDNCRMQIMVIPMNSKPFEDTGQDRTTFTVPDAHVGDGKWHEGVISYDYSAAPLVKWLHVSVRLVGGAGEMLLDDVSYVERTGPILDIARLSYWPDPKRGAEAGVVTALVRNAGDEPLDGARMNLELPNELRRDGAEKMETGPLKPKGESAHSWNVKGFCNTGSSMSLTVGTGGLSAERSFRFKPDLETEGFWSDRFIVREGAAATLTLWLRNHGMGTQRPVTSRIILPGGISLAEAGETRDFPPIRSGEKEKVSWDVVLPNTAGLYEVQAVVEVPGVGELKAPCSIYVSDGMYAAPRALTDVVRMKSNDHQAHFEIVPGGAGEPVAVIPWTARIMLRKADGGIETVITAAPGKVDARGEEANVATGGKDADGGVWETKTRFARLSETLTEVTTMISCNEDREVTHIEGPTLLAGEGGTGDAKIEGLFCGLEWMEGDETSSGRLDIAPDHAHRNRWMQHPNMVTIPVMSVAIDKTTVVGLMWDPRQEWMEGRRGPQPIYAGPDRFEGRRSHAMGLAAPSAGDGREPNEICAAKPFRLPAGETVTLKAIIYADAGAKDALSAMDAWLARTKPDDIIPPPKGDYAEQTEFMMRAYFESLWVSPEEGWLPFLGGPGVWRKASHNPMFCYDLLLAARMTKDPKKAEAYRERAKDQLRDGLRLPSAEDFGFMTGAPVMQLSQLTSLAGGARGSQLDDGSWRFDADLQDPGIFKGMDYHELGADDAAELGTCALRARDLLRNARITGDYKSYVAGRKSLNFMLRFKVPRAAQVWEVPVHSPDILAAAHAVQAFLEAYRYDGREEWLDEAKRWARAGLPFVYVWNDDRYPWMRYGSIPVFGASWWQCSWFGNIVQWNGLDYALALRELHDYDPEPKGMAVNWERFAEGLTVSAMHMQSDKPEIVALWCDSYSALTGDRNWDFAPTRVLRNMCALMGQPQTPMTAIVSRGQSMTTRGASRCGAPIKGDKPPARIHASACAKIESLSWQKDRATLRAEFWKGIPGYAIFSCVSRPGSVTLNGRRLAELDDLLAPEKEGFRYDSGNAYLAVCVTTDGKVEIVCDGIEHAEHIGLPDQAERIDFTFAAGTQGWQPANDLDGFRIAGDALEIRSTGGDPYITRTACNAPAADAPVVLVRMSVSKGNAAQFFWTTDSQGDFSEDKSVTFPVIADGNYHDYVLNVSANPRWTGRITAIRLDPCNDAGAVIRIRHIKAGK